MTRYKELLLMLCLTLLMVSIPFDSQGQTHIPEELQLAFKFLNKKLNQKQIEEFKNTQDSDLVLYHHTMGLYVRNTLLRNHRYGKELGRFFYELDIRHRDDKSSIILTSYHRYLNNEPIELDEQVEYYKAYWKPINACKDTMRWRATTLFKEFEVGDTLVVQMPMGDNNSAVDYGCPTVHWEYSDSTGLQVVGVVMEKYNINSATNVFFKLSILEKSKPSARIMMREVGVGDKYALSLSTAWRISRFGPLEEVSK